MTKKPWTPYEEALVRRFYPICKTEHLALLLGRGVRSVYQHADLMGVEKSREWLQSPEACYLKRNPAASEPGRFKPGNISWNKGLRRPGWAPGRMAQTQFKKGEIRGFALKRWKPLGSVRLSKEGYREIKVRERRNKPGNWVGEHILIWEKAHGPVPPGHVVVFRDGDQTHIVLENLELISRADLMRRNTVHNLPKELALVVQLAGALTRKVRQLEKQTD